MSKSEKIDEIIKNRRSIRWFLQEPVPEEDLKEILEAGIRAPTASGAEQWFFLVVRNDEKRKIIHDYIRRGQMIYLSRMLIKDLSSEELKKWEELFDRGIYLAPLYIIGLLNYNRRSLKDEYLLYEYLWGVESVTLALGYMGLKAWSLGYGSVWIAVPQLLEEEFKRDLEIPINTSYVGMLAIGKPAETPPIRPRKPLEEVVSYR